MCVCVVYVCVCVCVVYVCCVCVCVVYVCVCVCRCSQNWTLCTCSCNVSKLASVSIIKYTQCQTVAHTHTHTHTWRRHLFSWKNPRQDIARIITPKNVSDYSRWPLLVLWSIGSLMKETRYAYLTDKDDVSIYLYMLMVGIDPEESRNYYNWITSEHDMDSCQKHN